MEGLISDPSKFSPMILNRLPVLQVEAFSFRLLKYSLLYFWDK